MTSLDERVVAKAEGRVRVYCRVASTRPNASLPFTFLPAPIVCYLVIPRLLDFSARSSRCEFTYSLNMSRTQSHKVTPAVQARISDCQLVNRETSAKKVADYRDTLFILQEEQFEKKGHPEGSPWQVWFREISQSLPPPLATSDPNNVSGLSVYDFHDPQTRNVVLKKDAAFLPKNLFFRTVDTGRLLPMECADFRIEWYAHESHWEGVDDMQKKEKNAPSWEAYTLAIMVGMTSPQIHPVSSLISLAPKRVYRFTNSSSFAICTIKEVQISLSLSSTGQIVP